MPLRTTTPWWGVALDCPDSPALARFYAALLGWEELTEGPTWSTLAPSKEAGYYIAFQREDKYVRPVWPAVEGKPQMSMHLDIEVDDLAEAVAYAVSVGAEEASFQPQDDVRVLLDPDGHPFCLYVDSND
jgi:catechol 2,3-dioxygenase-like lactoylglutathione lyase family enzyme